MTATTKNLLAASAPGASEQGFHPVQGQQFVGPQNNRIGQNLAQAKTMGGMAPPASPAMGGPMKDQKDVKPMINNPSGIPEGSPHNAPAAPGQGGPSSNPTGSAHGTAPPTPNTINSSITQSPAPNGTPSVPPASNPASQPQPNLSDLTPNFMSSDFIQSMSALEDLDPSMFRTDFEQDFREWFDPTGVDLK
jgi:collagen type III alpha